MQHWIIEHDISHQFKSHFDPEREFEPHPHPHDFTEFSILGASVSAAFLSNSGYNLGWC